MTSARVLATFADPAEVKPGATVTLSGLFASAAGEATGPPVDWAICNARKSLSELGPVNPACLQPAASFLTEVGGGISVQATIPTDACRNFGPDLPVPVAGQPSGRPVDADPTGGYYQPVRVRIATNGADVYALAQVRIDCGLPAATSEQTVQFNQQYFANENPTIDALTITRANGDVITAGDDVITVSPGETLRVTPSWAACPTTPQTCSGAESYLRFDPDARALVTSRESLRVSWFSAGGSWSEDHAGVGGDDQRTAVDGEWTAPSKGDSTLWVVLRDDRGGASFRRVHVTVP